MALKPTKTRCPSEQDQLVQIKTGIANFVKKGYASLGIITKTNGEAKQLYELLSSEGNVHLLSPNSSRFANGVLITSVQMSKGLEFDEVIIPFVSNEFYSTEYEKGLLYIAVTRAMHRLRLLYVGTASPFIQAMLP